MGMEHNMASYSLDRQIEAYEEMREFLEAKHFREWVVFYNGELVDTYDSDEDAAVDAVQRFGRGPYLIRQVGAPPRRLPASLQFRRVFAND